MSKHYAYCVTWNNYTEQDLEFWQETLKEECQQWAWQLEIGESGTPHIQAVIRFNNKRSFKAIKKLFPKCHLEPTKNWKEAVKYCQKTSTSTGQRDVNVLPDRNSAKEDEVKIDVKDPMEGLQKKSWQIKIDEIISKPPDARSIFWYYDTNGGLGKTTYAKHLALRLAPNFIYLSGKASDVKCGIADMVSKGNNPDVCIFDYTRTSESFVSYEAIESVKNGIFYSGKYESGMVLFNTPHIIIFSNFAPNFGSLSKDRWVIEDLTEN